ncbi:hypothetical protein ACEPAG_2408 [Sanghuangporus baumii]
MRFSLQLPVHLILYTISLLDEDNLTRGEPVPPTLVYPERVAVYNSLFSLKSSSRFSSNWTQRAAVEEGEVEDVLCHPAGSCEPCPEDLLQEPYCQPFGNRRLLHCVEVPSTPESDRPSPDTRPDGEGPETDDNRDGDIPHVPPPHHPASRPPQSALPAYESCGRRVPKERADFLEFVLCNVIFTALALTGVLIRSERMRAVRARRLAARIGVGLRRASSGSWAAVGGMGAALVEAEARSEEAQLMRDDDSGS